MEKLYEELESNGIEVIDDDPVSDVDASLLSGRDIGSDTIRRQLIYGIMRNCQGKHKYARNRIVIPGISEATFSRRKERFLHDIAKYAGLLVKGDTDST